MDDNKCVLGGSWYSTRHCRTNARSLISHFKCCTECVAGSQQKRIASLKNQDGFEGNALDSKDVTTCSLVVAQNGDMDSPAITPGGLTPVISRTGTQTSFESLSSRETGNASTTPLIDESCLLTCFTQKKRIIIYYLPRE